MKAILHLSTTVGESLEKFSALLVGEGFIFAEEDRTYVVRYRNKRSKKILNQSQFWSRKNLGDELPPTYSLVVKGMIRQCNGGSLVEFELIEYHANHPHRLNCESVDFYFDVLTKKLLQLSQESLEPQNLCK